MNSFQKIKRGIEILALYNPSFLYLNPVNRVSPFSGEPDFTHAAYLTIEVGTQIWDMTKEEREELISLGFKPEQEDQYWIHFGG
jgi:hypothetical protein